MDEGDPKNAKEAIENLQAVFGDLDRLVFNTPIDSRADALEVLAHIGLSLAEIVACIDWINHRGPQWMSEIGHVEVLCNDSGIHNLTIVEAVTMVGSIQGPPAAPEENPSAGLEVGGELITFLKKINLKK